MSLSWRQAWVWMLGLLFSAGASHAQPGAQSAGKPPMRDFSIAFYYATDIPWEALGAFDMAVVDPGNVTEAGWSHRLNPATEVAAYVSVGEVHPSRPYFAQMPKTWQLGQNTDWGSVVLDQANPQWRQFFISQIIGPLWAKGYRAFFLDTLDSFHIVAKTPDEKASQEAGMVALLQAVKAAHPEAKLIFNRGFEILPKVHGLAHAVAAESLFQGYDAAKAAFKPVPQNDFDWLWGQLLRCKTEYGLPVIGIDYVPADQRALARQTAQKIRALGAIAWVATPELNSIGVGNVELLPRQVLALHDEPGHLAQVASHEMHRLGEMPLNALGLHADLVAVGSAVLERHAKRPIAGRYAGVVMWFNGGSFPKSPTVLEVFNRARLEGVPVVVLGEMPHDAAVDAFGMDVGDALKPTAELQLERRSPHVGFEVMPSPLLRELWPVTLRQPNAPNTQVWLRVRAGNQVYSDAIAITPWGGYASELFFKLDLPQDKGVRWAVNPMEFFKQALRVDEAIPMPDVTTESGRRLLLIHIDGDGFPSRAEIPKTPLASEVMLTEFLQRYPLPTTVSVIEGEVGSAGLYAALSPQMEDLARRMFALPHVELASHTFSHPFFWAEAEMGLSRGSRPVGLKIPNYQFNVRREIRGSADYINRRLAPPGKTTRMLLWSGDTQPLEAPVREAYQAGLLNMNSGYTTVSRANPSLTLVAPIGMMKGEYYQVYAPNQNENVYTNDWTGPFYGFDRVIETFEMTDLPVRLKPVNLYYHTYIASKPASIASLHKVYAWINQQSLHPIYSSEYAERVLDWRRATVARVVGNAPAASTLELRAGGKWLKTWRTALAGPADLGVGFAGSNSHGAYRYHNAIQSIATTSMNTGTDTENVQKSTPAALFNLPSWNANGQLRGWQMGQGRLAMRLHSHVPLQAQFDTACAFDPGQSSPGLKAQRKSSATAASGFLLHIDAPSRGEQTIVFRCAG